MTQAAAPFALGGAVALVTGGAGCIGGAVVRRLLWAGATVASLDLPGHPPPEGAVTIPCDLAVPMATRGAVASILEQFGRVDVVVHAAGVTGDAVCWKLEDEAWDRVMAINLSAAFHLVKAVVPAMRQRGGSIVCIASINGERGKFGQTNYAASKGGLIAFSKSVARELGRFGVRVNCVAPGFIETAMTRDLPAQVRQQALRETALDRVGTAEDVGNAVLFLSSRLASHITGQTLRVDGGQLMA